MAVDDKGNLNMCNPILIAHGSGNKIVPGDCEQFKKNVIFSELMQNALRKTQ